METDIAIGIDLGTTNSCVAIYRNDKVDILENEMGNRTTPSWVTFTEDGIVTGPEAVAQAHVYPKTAIYEVKRLIGQKFIDEKIQEDIRKFPFPVFNDLGSPKIRIELKNAKAMELYPEDISAYVLIRMKKIAERKTNKKIARAVITVPAYFDNAQRNATITAAKIAGFTSINIINEPTAAALAYVHENKKECKENVLVFDFGGGTFDVSVLNVEGCKCKVIATRGDSHLGGTDIDSLLANVLRMLYQSKFGKELDPNCPKIARRLKDKAERAKIAMSGDRQFGCDLEMELGNEYYHTHITRHMLERLSAPLLSRTMDCVTKCLEDCNLDKSEIDEVVLVGGSSRIPKVQELIKQYFGADKINQSVNPDEAVAYGAAVYAAILEKADKETSYSIVDVLSFTIGTNVQCDQMSPIIVRNTPLPATEFRRYHTIYDDQVTMDFPIFQGENSKASENILLGEFTMTGLTKAPANTVQVEIKCHIDTDGILSVSAQELNTKNYKKVIIEVKRVGLTNEQIQDRIREAQLNDERIKQKLQFDEAKYLLQESLDVILEYRKKEAISNSADILDKYYEIHKWLENAKAPDFVKLLEFIKELTNLMNEIN